MSAAVRTVSEMSAAAALRLPFMPSSLASAFARKSSAHAGFTFLTKRFPRVDHSAAYHAYIARRKETSTMKRIVLALCITAAASFALAQEPHAMKMRMMAPNADEVAATLGLSVDQKVQFDSIHQQLEASVGPLFQQLES